MVKMVNVMLCVFATIKKINKKQIQWMWQNFGNCFILWLVFLVLDTLILYLYQILVLFLEKNWNKYSKVLILIHQGKE